MRRVWLNQRVVAVGLASVASACGEPASRAPASTPVEPAGWPSPATASTTAVDTAGAFAPIVPPPPELVARLRLSPLYVQYLDVGHVPILASAAVTPYALREAYWIVWKMIGHRPDVLDAIAASGVRLVVMAPTEMTTDVPEHADLTPKAFWDRRARGVGATLARPATSCAEENLLELRGDPYAAESILVHEFGHTIHQHGLARLDPTFQARLLSAFALARRSGRWDGTYAATNADEYWAEATQSWFDTNRANDNEHGPIDTREKLKAYDPEIATLLREAYGDGPWRYLRPSRRSPAERAHLGGFDPNAARAFVWPASAPPLDGPSAYVGPPTGLLRPDALPSASPPSDRATSLTFINRRHSPVSVEWVGFRGERHRYFVLAPGGSQVQPTYAGHVWVFVDASRARVVLGGVVAGAATGTVEVPNR